MLSLAFLLLPAAAFAEEPAVCSLVRHYTCTQSMVHMDICPAHHEAEHLLYLQRDVGMLCRQKAELNGGLHDLGRATGEEGSERVSLPCCESVSALCYVAKQLGDERKFLRDAEKEVRAKAAAAAGGQSRAFTADSTMLATSKKKLGEIKGRLENLQGLTSRTLARLSALRADEKARFQRVMPLTQGNFCGNLLPKIHPVMDRAAAELVGYEEQARRAHSEVTTELSSVKSTLEALEAIKPAAKKK